MNAVAMQDKLFDALCVVVIHHFADMNYWRKRGESDKQKLAKARKILRKHDIIDEHEALAEYDAWVEACGVGALPDRYEPVRDYWGARCFSCLKHETPRVGWYGGDEVGRWAWFDGSEAIEEYTKHVLERIEQGEDR